MLINTSLTFMYLFIFLGEHVSSFKNAPQFSAELKLLQSSWMETSVDGEARDYYQTSTYLPLC